MVMSLIWSIFGRSHLGPYIRYLLYSTKVTFDPLERVAQQARDRRRAGARVGGHQEEAQLARRHGRPRHWGDSGGGRVLPRGRGHRHWVRAT